MPSTATRGALPGSRAVLASGAGRLGELVADDMAAFLL
jgi:hypothetical protein